MEIQQRSVMSHFNFAIAVNFVIKLVREGVLSELLYADDFIMMSRIIEGL